MRKSASLFHAGDFSKQIMSVTKNKSPFSGTEGPCVLGFGKLLRSAYEENSNMLAKAIVEILDLFGTVDSHMINFFNFPRENMS